MLKSQKLGGVSTREYEYPQNQELRIHMLKLDVHYGLDYSVNRLEL
jgi:hypothetical protein